MNELRSSNGMASTGHPLSAQVGADLLQAGGNAIDAAVGAALAQVVLDPANCGLGGYGGCLMVSEAASGRIAAVDFDGRAPLAAAEDMFELEPAELRSTVISRELGVNVKGDEMTRGPKSIAVPGTLAGLGAVHEEFGSMPWEKLVAPAVVLARDGFLVSASLANSISGLAHSGRDFPVTIEMLMPQGRPPKPGDTIRLPGLAKTLQRIADEGWRALYEGEMAKRIADYVQSSGGILAEKDLAEYQARICEPCTVRYRDHHVSTPPLPNGGTTTLQTLSILSGFDLTHWERESPEILHLIAETFKLAWRDRAEHFGDPECVDVDVDRLLSPEYAAELQTRLRSEVEPDHGAPRRPGPATCTTQICAVDSARNMVSATMSHGMAYGSLVTVPGLGVTLNHGMCRLDPRPGRPNSIAPGKRLLNNMSPVLVHRDGRPILAAGAPGGRHIMGAVAQFLINVIDFGMSPSDAFDMPRCFCDDAEPLVLEQRIIRSRRDDQSPFPQERARIGVKIDWSDSDALFQGLSAMGHSVEFSGAVGGSVHAIQVSNETEEILSGFDPRGLGATIGY